MRLHELAFAAETWRQQHGEAGAPVFYPIA